MKSRLLAAAGLALVLLGAAYLLLVGASTAPSPRACDGVQPLCGLEAGLEAGAATILRASALAALALGAVGVAAGARRG